MKKKARTIEALRNSMDGKIYVKTGSEAMFQRFLADAEAEGYMIGDKKPTESRASFDIKAIEYDKRIANIGTIGHIACQAGGGAIHIIDYERYVSGEKEYEVTSL